jgi:hypothetical protein
LSHRSNNETETMTRTLTPWRIWLCFCPLVFSSPSRSGFRVSKVNRFWLRKKKIKWKNSNNTQNCSPIFETS